MSKDFNSKPLHGMGINNLMGIADVQELSGSASALPNNKLIRITININRKIRKCKSQEYQQQKLLTSHKKLEE